MSAAFLDGDALRVARVKALERAFEVELSPADAASCTTEKATAQAFDARVGAVSADGNLHATAMAAVREALRMVLNADAESIDEDSDLEALRRGTPPFSVWWGLARELRCRLPPLRWTWWAVGLTASVLVTQGVLLVVTDDIARFWLFALAILSLGTLLPIWIVAVVIQRGRFPGSMGRVGALAGWLVAARPSRLRGGTEWTTGQVAEVVAATYRLDFARTSADSPAASFVTLVFAAASTVLAFTHAFRVAQAVL